MRRLRHKNYSKVLIQKRMKTKKLKDFGSFNKISTIMNFLFSSSAQTEKMKMDKSHAQLDAEHDKYTIDKL